MLSRALSSKFCRREWAAAEPARRKSAGRAQSVQHCCVRLRAWRRASSAQPAPSCCLSSRLPLAAGRRCCSVAAVASAEVGRTATPQELTALVETAMFAACTGLAYHFSASFRLESYFGAFFPLPTVLAAARWRGAVAWKTMVATSLLLLLLGGPLRATMYLLLHGSLGVALGLLWRQKCSWLISIPCTALIRCAGVFGSLAVSSLLLRENVLALVAAQMFALLDQMSAAVGLTTTPEFHWVYFLAATLVLVNSVSYVTLLHLLYALVLGRIGGGFGNAPAFVRRAFLQP